MRVGLGIGIGMIHGVPWVPTAPTLTAPVEAVDVYNDVGVAWAATVTAGQVPDRIDLVLDSSTVVATDSTSPYGGTWTPSGVSAGAHTLKARFVYGSGYVDSAATNIVLFDPTVVAGLVLWLRADLGITKDGSDRVSQWADQSGNGRHLAQGTADKQPLWLATGGNASEPCIAFDGSNDFLRATWTQAQPVHAFLASKFMRAPASGETMMDGSAGNSMRYQELGTAVGAQTTAILTRTVTVVAWHLTEMQFNGGSGSLVVDGGAAATGNIGTTAPGGICLGLYGDQASLASQCRIAEVVLYDNSISGTPLTRLRAYSAAKHGV